MSAPAHPARHAPVVALSGVSVSCTDAGHCFRPGLCVSLAPQHRGASFALRGPRRDPRTDEKPAALQRPLSSSWDSPAGQSGFSQPAPPRPVPSSWAPCSARPSRVTQGGPGRAGSAGHREPPVGTQVDAGSPSVACVACSRTVSSPLPEARARRVRQEGPCLILASLMTTGGL